ncbi:MULTISPECIES: YfhO family protein [Spirulina sp. CCY15215]|uniref:YfhO family protein n=1 Tax=Spirulina sp. CCY15215 TaxID=2767591 RepID=UPI0019508678|nr:YfhO family protein [Spirulina major]
MKLLYSLKSKKIAIDYLIPSIVFCWPILYFFRQVIPIGGKYFPIGNDFDILYYNYKAYLLDHLVHFSFPLWSPSEGGGYPFYSNPFAAAFYPLNLPLAIFYKLAGGYTRFDHQLFTVLGISIFALGLFFWLKQFRLNLRAILFATLIMSVSFKVAEILRFPNAVHTAAWYPWILFAVTKIIFSQSTRESFRYSFALIFFTICLLAAGYPYYIFYSVFLFGAYFIIFLIPDLSTKFFQKEKTQKPIYTLLFLTGSFGISSLICLPYLYNVSKLLQDISQRDGKNIDFSMSLSFSFQDTLGSLIFPPTSLTEGWYYFGILSVLLILLYIFSFVSRSVYNRKITINSEETKSDRASIQEIWYLGVDVKLYFIVYLVIISYITYGGKSWLFRLLWEYLPLFSSLRAWSRMNIILVPMLSILLAISYQYLEDVILKDKIKTHRWKNIFILIASYSAILITQLYFYLNKIYDSHGYWLLHYGHVASQDIYFVVYGALAFLLLAYILWNSRKWLFSQKVLTIVCLVCIILTTLDTRGVGAKMWGIRANDGKTSFDYVQLFDVPSHQEFNIPAANLKSFSIPRTEHTFISLFPQFNAGTVGDWFFKRYNQFFKFSENEPEERKKILGIVDGQKIYFSESINHASIHDFLEDAEKYKNFARVISYTGNKLVLDVSITQKGYLSFIDNWDKDWEASIDEKQTPIELLFATFKSVPIKSGRHEIIFTYRPKLFFF